jgi:hypothetical protein
MNDNTGDGSRVRRRAGRARAGVLAAALSGIALLAAACGGGGSSAAAGSASGQPPYQQALAYSQCMRTHGEPGFPDPNSQGASSHIPPPSPQYQSANNACEHLLSGHQLTAAQKRENVGQALKYSACMRSHGITGFPDPIVVQGGRAVGFRVSGIDRSSPQFQSAQQACRKFEPGLSGGGAP